MSTTTATVRTTTSSGVLTFPTTTLAQNGTAEPSSLYDYIIFYRWLSPDGAYERGRVMARLVAEVMEKTTRLSAVASRPRHSIWLDQREIQRTAAPDVVVGKIADTFTLVDQVIILAAPGDWGRFVNEDDIHRWEWELSLRSDKKVWVLQYGLPDDSTAFSGEELAKGLGAYNPRLAELARKKNVNVRAITMDSIDVVLKEIAEAS